MTIYIQVYYKNVLEFDNRKAVYRLHKVVYSIHSTGASHEQKKLFGVSTRQWQETSPLPLRTINTF